MERLEDFRRSWRWIIVNLGESVAVDLSNDKRSSFRNKHCQATVERKEAILPDAMGSL